MKKWTRIGITKGSIIFFEETIDKTWGRVQSATLCPRWLFKLPKNLKYERAFK